ncbi:MULTISPECIES: hypothetical protein [Methylobacterium]|uniref:Uncharacterized protein n=1 Tax=Methylobacterium thuringiense TaxID=1003091 RepID=A0ABQ4TTD4_9HYPH|nr:MULTISPECIES: hypothetical protein [Methylobacterium]TXN23481.1 hypothetical protein FV217_06990 [Methylobacterium sp. WL9]GJE57203.1 hypothetical protein EKPJFOCH_3716 [Methylobacterium thuringiense]
MSFFIGIGCSWLLVAVMMLWAHRRAENPETGQWRSEPSTFFGGPIREDAAAEPDPGKSAI